MSLTKYKQKRNFKSTAEPEGKVVRPDKELIFVIQMHDASHLHYDFRLELDGTLKSWAVPKGPSMNPADKRLAMMVEDHPYSYKDFEGNIPEGNYGAGNVIVWDQGTYSAPEALDAADARKKLKAGLMKGHLAIEMKGKKLKGKFDLIKLRGKQENAWLLVKKQDKFASEENILKKNKSVISKKALVLKDRSKGKKVAVKKSGATLPKKKTEKEKILLTFQAPMLAKTAEEVFDRENWIFEKKHDGYRTLAVVNENSVDLFSRNQLSFNAKFKPVADELGKIGHSLILDGEVVVEDSKGRSDFQLLQNYQKTGVGVLKYFVFDVLSIDGYDVTGLPLIERKALLKLALKSVRLKNIIYSEHVVDKGQALYKQAVKDRLEGIMAKDAASPYRVGRRSEEWLKIKINNEEEAVIIGITEPKGGRSYFGSLLLAQYSGKELKYIGNCGTGFSESTLKELYSKFKTLFVNQSPLKEKIKSSGKVQWIKPKYVCQVRFTEWTQDGHLRHPVYLGLRIDKGATDVETPAAVINMKDEKMKKKETKSARKGTSGIIKTATKPASRSTKAVKTASKKSAASKKSVLKKKAGKASNSGGENDVDLKVGKTILHLTNQNKVYFPQDGITKGDVVNYYSEVADVMLPYLKDRPQSMNRFPNGIKGPSFYQKDIDVEKSPDWLRTEKVYSESNDKYIDYLICNDKATLMYMANLGCIEINPWNSTLKNIENPDWVVIDIDPSKDDFKEVVKTALTVRAILDELETESYCKTSGATGLHVYIPLGAKYNYDTVKLFAELVARQVTERLPDTTTTIRSIQKRNRKIYIDFLQNRRGQTLAAPYSVRPKPGATVSTPLEWSEVSLKLLPTDFTIKNTLKRLDKKGDLWKPVLGKGANLNKVINIISEQTEQTA